MLLSVKSTVLPLALDVFFNKLRFSLFFKGLIGFAFIQMPSFFFFKVSANEISFVFLGRFYYIAILKHIVHLYKGIFSFGFIKLRLKGLGYRVRMICHSFFKFFFGSTNFFYFYSPNNFQVRVKKRHLVFLSNKLFLLKSLLSHLLLLKKLSVYRVRGLVYPRQMMYLKIGKKSF